MSIRTKVMNHPLLAEFDDQDPSIEPYKYWIRLVEGYQISGYGGQTKHCLTLKDCLNYLDTAENKIS